MLLLSDRHHHEEAGAISNQLGLIIQGVTIWDVACMLSGKVGLGSQFSLSKVLLLLCVAVLRYPHKLVVQVG